MMKRVLGQGFPPINCIAVWYVFELSAGTNYLWHLVRIPCGLDTLPWAQALGCVKLGDPCFCAAYGTAARPKAARRISHAGSFKPTVEAFIFRNSNAPWVILSHEIGLDWAL